MTNEIVLVIVALWIGLAIGALVVAWFQRRSHRLSIDAALASAGAEAQARIAAVEAHLEARDAEMRDLHARLEAATNDGKTSGDALADARVAHATLDAQLQKERESAAERLATLTQARDELTAHFKALAGEALEANRQRMTEQQHGALDQILKPLGEKLVAFERKVDETYEKETEQRRSLRQQVESLHAATMQINEDAKNLTLALKGEAKTRGNWGEVVLERVLERSGLIKGREYQVQLALRDDDGALSRPDVVILLPDNKHVVIDSKVSLVAYDNYYAAVDDAGRVQAGRQHVEGMRRHAKALGEKNYQGDKLLDSPDFVAMFVPIEPAFGLASSLDAELFLDAWELGVVIVTPSTLLALLMTVQTLWQRDKQVRNAIEIAEESGKLHDQFVGVLEALSQLGKQLRDAQKAFELTENRLVEGRGNLVGRIKKLQDMGAKTKKQLPPDLLGRASDENDDAGGRDADKVTPTGNPSKLTLVATPGSVAAEAADDVDPF